MLFASPTCCSKERLRGDDRGVCYAPPCSLLNSCLWLCSGVFYMVEVFCLYFAGSLVIDEDVSINDLLQRREKKFCKSPPGPAGTNKK